MSHTNAQKIGVATATIVGMNAMIGSGIFTAPATIASNVGPAGILAYLFVIAAIWFMASSIARVAFLYPEEGSFYTYSKPWAGHIGGLIAVISYFIGLLIAMGLLSRIAGIYLQPYFPATPAHNLGLIALAVLVILNMFGVVLSRLGQHILIACTVFPLLTTTILCLSKINIANLFPFAPYGLTNALKATRVVIFGFFGFECAASLFNIVRHPEKNVPRALTYSILLVGGIYTLFVASIILAMPLHYFTSPTMPISETLAVLFPENSWIITIIHGAILSAIVGTIHSMIWSSSNLLMLIIQRLKSSWAHRLVSSGIIQQKTSVLLVGAAILVSYTTLKNPHLFFLLTAIFIVFAYVMSMITLLFIPKEWESQQNIKTIFGLITALIIFTFAVEGLIQEIIKLF